MPSSSPKKSPPFAACLSVFHAYLLARDLLQLRAALHTDSRSDQAQLVSRALETVYESLSVDLLPFMDVRAIFNAADSESELYRQFLLDYHAAQQHLPALFTRLLSSQEDAVAAFMCAACDLNSLMHEALVNAPDIQVIGYLIAHPRFDVNAPNHERNTPLHTAIIDVHKHAYTGFAEILLTDPRLDINHQGQHNYTPLDLAIRNLNVDQTPYNIAFVTQLLAHPDIDLNRSTTQHLHECIRSHLFTTARELFTHPTQNKYLRDGDGRTPLMNVCSAHDDRHSSRPLQDEHIALFETILTSPETDINAQSYSSDPVLIWALGCSHFTARLLQQPGIQPNLASRSGHTPLMAAAKFGLPSLQLLLDDPRVDVNQQDVDGNTALHLAQKNKQVGAVEALLQHPYTDPSILNHQRESALPDSSQTGGLSANSLFNMGSYLPRWLRRPGG